MGSRTSDTTASTKPQGPKLTSATRRGLLDLRQLVVDSFDDRKPPSFTVAQRWSKKRRDEYQQAVMWIAATCWREDAARRDGASR